MRGWNTATHYANDTVNYTEPLFVVVIMALASTRPIIMLAESWVRALARIGGGTPGAWWLVILTVTPLLGSFITEPAAMTIAALLLARRFYDLNPSPALEVRDPRPAVRQRVDRRHAHPLCRAAGADGVANVGVDNALHAQPFRLALGHRDRRVVAGLLPVVQKGIRGARGRQRGARGGSRRGGCGNRPGRCCRCRRGSRWCTSAFMAWTVVNAHYPGLFVGGFLFFIGFTRATAAYQAQLDMKTPLLVGFFLAGLVIHGGLQGWWIAPVLTSLSRGRAVLGRHRPDRLQRQRAHHLPRDAGAELSAKRSRSRSSRAPSPAAA